MRPHMSWALYCRSPAAKHLSFANGASEKTDFPPHIRPALAARRNAVRLAFASAAFREMRGGLAPAGRLPVPSLEPALVGFSVRARISAPRGYPFQLGVWSDHLPRTATTRARRRNADRDGGPWRKSEPSGRRALRHRWGRRRPCRDRRASGNTGATAEGYRDRHPGTGAAIRRLQIAPIDRSSYQPAFPGLVGSRRRRARQ